MRGAARDSPGPFLKKDVVSQMNTKSLLTRIGVPVLSLGLLGGLGATLATSASAGYSARGGHAQRECHAIHGHGRRPPPTCPACQTPRSAALTPASGERQRPGNADRERFGLRPGLGHRRHHQHLSRVTPLGNGQYAVDRLVNGTFEAFAQPNAGLPAPKLDPGVKGQVHGTNSYVVTSAHRPRRLAAAPGAAERRPAPTRSSGSCSGASMTRPSPAATTWVFAYHTAHGSMTQRYDTHFRRPGATSPADHRKERPAAGRPGRPAPSCSGAGHRPGHYRRCDSGCRGRRGALLYRPGACPPAGRRRPARRR